MVKPGWRRRFWRTGEERRSAWREAADRLGGTLREGKRGAVGAIEIVHREWAITLDTYVVSQGSAAVTYTRARAFAPGWRGLRLVARERSWLDRVGEAMGWVGRPPISPELANRYVVRGEPSSRVPSLFADRALSDALLAMPSVRLEVRRPARKERKMLGEGFAEVKCRTTGVVTDVARLAALAGLVGATLDALHRVGEASAPSGREAWGGAR